MIKYSQIPFILLTVILLSSCGSQEVRQSSTSDKLHVFVSIPPQSSIVERIGGEYVSVDILVQPGDSPHTFEPTPRQMIELNRARLLFSIGMPFESMLIEKISKSSKRLEFAAMDEGVKKRAMGWHDHERHLGNEHSKTHPDPHIWLAPENIRIMARITASALSSVDPVHSDYYRKNLLDYLVEVDSVDAGIIRILQPFKGGHFYVFHPSFGYFADAYGLHQEAVEIGGKSPSIKQLNELVTKAKSENVRIIFVQPQFDQRSAKSVADAIGGAVIPLDPMKKDVLRNLEEIANFMVEAFE